jgi:hypothetical protein
VFVRIYHQFLYVFLSKLLLLCFIRPSPPVTLLAHFEYRQTRVSIGLSTPRWMDSLGVTCQTLWPLKRWQIRVNGAWIIQVNGATTRPPSAISHLFNPSIRITLSQPYRRLSPTQSRTRSPWIGLRWSDTRPQTSPSTRSSRRLERPCQVGIAISLGGMPVPARKYPPPHAEARHVAQPQVQCG